MKIEKQNLSSSMCEELFGGELDVVEVPDDCNKSQARQHRNWLHQLNERDWCSLQKVMDTLKRMEDFFRNEEKHDPPHQGRPHGGSVGDAGPEREHEAQRLPHRALRVPSYGQYGTEN